jgi:hypothetical protein
MMSGIHLDPKVPDAERRALIYAGGLVLLSPTEASLALAAFARELIEEAFAPRSPQTAHRELPVEEFVQILAALKPRFIHHPRSKELIRGILTGLSCDLQQVHYDVPRLRTAAPKDYLSSGIAYAFHPHRDTWYSAPQCQINWWMPVYPFVPENGMAFHPHHWSNPLKNGSRDYNYRRWNQQSRFNAASHIKSDTRQQPKPEEPAQTEPAVRLVLPPGGLILFSGAQLHSTVPNTTDVTRVSVDFRTVHLGDAIEGLGAPNIDSACTGTSIGDFLRGSDDAPIPKAVVERYDTPDVNPL